jgi:hypothetical protein
MPGTCGPARTRAIANGTPALEADTVSVIEALADALNVVTIGQGGPFTPFQVAEADAVFGCWAALMHAQRRRAGTSRMERIRRSYAADGGVAICSTMTARASYVEVAS